MPMVAGEAAVGGHVVGTSNGHGSSAGNWSPHHERRQAEEALRSSETRFQTLADSAPLLIWMSGPDKLCSYLNQGWLDFTGRTIDEELGSGWTEGVFPEDFGRAWEIYESAFERRAPLKFEYCDCAGRGIFRLLYFSARPHCA